MADYEEGGIESTGLLGSTLRLAAIVVASGLAVVLWLDSRDVANELGAARVQDTPSVSKPVSNQRGGSIRTPGAGSEIELQAGAHGHFMVNATVNGEVLRFLVDTGASSIFLTPQDAERIGFTSARLTFSERYDTANGEIRAAPVTLRSLRIGQLEFYDLPASVGESPGSVSLLGMSFLKRFDSYQVRGDTLILAW